MREVRGKKKGDISYRNKEGLGFIISELNLSRFKNQESSPKENTKIIREKDTKNNSTSGIRTTS